MASTQDPGELHEGRDGQRELYRLVNWLRRRVGGTSTDADFWTSSDQTAILPSSVNLGALSTGILQHTVTAGVSTPGVVTVGAGLTYVTTTLDRAALTGDVTAAAGSNTTAFRSFVATSVLGRAAGSAGVPTEITASADGDVLRRAGGTLGFGTVPATSITGLFYQTIQNAGVAVTQQPIWNASTGLAAVNNGGATRTDVTAWLSTGIAGGQSVIGGTAASENLTYTSTADATKGLHIWGTTSKMYFDEQAGTLIMGTTTPFAQAKVEVVGNTNSGLSFTFVNTNAGTGAYTAFFLAQHPALLSGATFGTFLFSPGITLGTPYNPNCGLFELAGGSGNMHFWVQQAAGDYVWYMGATFPNPPERMRLQNAGTLRVDPNGLVTVATTVGIGTNSSHSDWMVNASRSINGNVAVAISNTSTGTAASGGYVISQASNLYGNNHCYWFLQGSGYSTVGPYIANSVIFEHVTNSAAAHLAFSAYGPQDIDFYTTTSWTRRFTIANAGDLRIQNAPTISFSSGAPITPTAPTIAQFAITPTTVAAAATVAPAWSWDSITQTLTGATAVTNGYTFYRFAQPTLTDASGVSVPWVSTVEITTPTIGGSVSNGSGHVALDMVIGTGDHGGWAITRVGATNYDRLVARYVSTGTYGAGYYIQTEAGGSATTGAIIIDAGAGGAQIGSQSNAASVLGGLGAVTVSAIAASERITYHSQFTRASATSMVLDAHKFETSVIITLTNNITTASGVNAVVFARPTYDGNGSAKTITAAATVMIENSPNATNSLTISTAYALWVRGGLVEFSGDAILSGNGAKTGFFGNTGSTRLTVTGSRGGNAALASLLTQLAAYNLISDGSSA